MYTKYRHLNWLLSLFKIAHFVMLFFSGNTKQITYNTAIAVEIWSEYQLIKQKKTNLFENILRVLWDVILRSNDSIRTFTGIPEKTFSQTDAFPETVRSDSQTHSQLHKIYNYYFEETFTWNSFSKTRRWWKNCFFGLPFLKQLQLCVGQIYEHQRVIKSN